MKQEYFKNLKHIFFIGIGGSSLSGLAKIMHSKGLKVSGSDNDTSEILYELSKIGITIFNGHSANHITNEIDLVVYSSAIKANNPELKKANHLNIKTMDRAEFLGLLANNYDNVIAISGVHGKTTTTAMIASIFINANLNPTVHLGGICNDTLSNVIIGDKKIFITEACEYKENFLKLNPNISVILNIELDHPDCYENEAKIFCAFEKFSDKTSEKLIILEQLNGFIQHKSKTTFGIRSNADYTAKNIIRNELGHIEYDLFYQNQYEIHIILNSYLKHDIYNSLSSVAVARNYEISYEDISKGLKNFSGIKRRMEYCGKIGDSIIIQDYAHHPTAIKSVLSNIKEIFNKKLICIFQPHTYSRTKSLMKEFMNSFDLADELAIYKSFSAREKSNCGATAKTLSKNINLKGKNCCYISNQVDLKKFLQNQKEKNCIIVMLGAGDMHKVLKKI